MKLFKADAGIFHSIQKRQFGFERLEKNLEDWLGANPHLLGDDILLIGRQVRTDHGIIDLLALDREGRTVVIELKRGRASREVVGQLNSYLTIVNKWSDRDLERNANLIPYNREVSNLVRRFKEHFKVSQAPDFDREPVGIVVAEDFEPDFITQISGLRFNSRVLQFSNFVTSGDDEFLLINPLHGSVEVPRPSATGNGAISGEAAKVPADKREKFSQLLDSVHELLKADGFNEAAGWRLHKSNRFVSGVFSCWKITYEGIALFFDREDGKTYLGTNCKPRNKETLSRLLKSHRQEIEKALGGDLMWDTDQWWSVSEITPDDPERIAARIRRYIEVLKPYMDQAIPGRSSTRGGGNIAKLQLEFWTGFQKFAKNEGSQLKIPAPRPQGWITMGSGGFLFVGIATQTRTTVYLAILGPARKVNFEALKAERTILEKEFGGPLQFEPLPHRKESQVQVHSDDRLLDRSSWPETYKWMLQSLERFHTIFVPRIKRLKLKA